MIVILLIVLTSLRSDKQKLTTLFLGGFWNLDLQFHWKIQHPQQLLLIKYFTKNYTSCTKCWKLISPSRALWAAIPERFSVVQWLMHLTCIWSLSGVRWSNTVTINVSISKKLNLLLCTGWFQEVVIVWIHH